MITALRGRAPQASCIRNPNRVALPSTSRRYHRFNPKSVVARRPYSTENDRASALDNAPNASADVQSETPGYTVIRGGFGDEDLDMAEDVGEEFRSEPRRRRQKQKRKQESKPSQWERLRNFESVRHEQPALGREDVLDTNPWPARSGNVHDTPLHPPANSSQRTVQEDIVTLCTYTEWERNQEWGYLHRGFEFIDFRAARSFIIEVMELKEKLGANMHLSNFGRYVYVQIGTPDESYESNQEPKAWSIGDGDVDLAWALPKAAKKYMGKRQMDAAAKPLSDFGFSDSWERTSRLIVPSKGRYHQVLDMRRSPAKWLTMEYRQLSEFNLSATQMATALVDQIAADMVQPDVGEGNMAFPVWCITEQTLAVSQTEFFSTSAASISKPGEGALQYRETVIPHCNFNLEQFNSMEAKETSSLKDYVKDRRHIRSLVHSVTIHWRHCNKHATRDPAFLNTSSDTVYLKDWGPFLTKELQPLVRRILVRAVPEHSKHVSALPDIYSTEAILQKYGDASVAVPDGNEPLEAQETSSDVRQWDNAAINRQGEHHAAGSQEWSKRRDRKIPDSFSGLVSVLRETFDAQAHGQNPEDSLGRDPDYELVRRLRVRPPAEQQLWRRQYFVLRNMIDESRRVLESRANDETTDDLSTQLVNLLYKVSFGSEIDWRSRYYELRRSAGSLGLLNNPETDDIKRQALAKRRKPLDWKHTTFYHHWLPGEKLNFNPVTVEDNLQQAWRPWNFKEFVTKQAREAMYQDSPSIASAPSSLITGARPIPPGTRPLGVGENENTPHVGLEDLGADQLHWLPGLSFPVDKHGRIRTSAKDQEWIKESEKRREELMDAVPNHEYNRSDQLPIRRHTAKSNIRWIEPSALDEPKIREMGIIEERQWNQSKGFKRVQQKEGLQILDQKKPAAAANGNHDVQPDNADATSLDMLLNGYQAGKGRRKVIDAARHDMPGSELAGVEPEGEGETTSETRSQPQASGDVSASADAATTSKEPSASAGAATQSTSAAEAALELGESPEISTAELGSKTGGMLNSADAERLLKEVGVSVEKEGNEHGERGERKEEKGGEHGEKEESSKEKDGGNEKDAEKTDNETKKSWWWW